MEFLYSLNRLNVATSRAKCVSAIVLSPSLVRVACHSPRQMRLANGLCLAVETAEHQRQAARGPGPAVTPDPVPDRDGAPLLLFPDLGPGEQRRADRP
jgi:hypothetical protein